MRHEALILPKQEKVRIQIPRLERGEPQARHIRLAQNCLDQVAQVRAIFLSPRTEMDTGQNNFLCPALQRRLNIENHIRDRAAAPLAACDGRDAKRAVIITAILHLDEGARAAMQPGQRFAGNRFEIKGFLWEV